MPSPSTDGTSPTTTGDELLTEVRRLILQVEHLTGQVSTLGEHIRISKSTTEAAGRATDRANILTKGAAWIAGLCLLLSFGVLYLFHQAHTNSVTACHNANEARAGNLAAWQFIIDASVRNHPNQTPAEERLTARFQHWINTLYAPHDCQHLDRVYPVPKPPTLTD